MSQDINQNVNCPIKSKRKSLQSFFHSRGWEMIIHMCWKTWRNTKAN